MVDSHVRTTTASESAQEEVRSIERREEVQSIEGQAAIAYDRRSQTKEVGYTHEASISEKMLEAGEAVTTKETAPIPLSRQSTPSSYPNGQISKPSTAGSTHSRRDEGDVEKAAGDPTAVEVPDQYIVDFEGPDDPMNAQNWSKKVKWSNVAVLSALTFISYVLDL